MKTAMMKRNWLSLLCVLVCLAMAMPGDLIAAPGGGGGGKERGSAKCMNLIDDDNDGKVDCADSDCNPAQTFCQAMETLCNDGFDNDGDGLIDGNDPDCAQTTTTTTSTTTTVPATTTTTAPATTTTVPATTTTTAPATTTTVPATTTTTVAATTTTVPATTTTVAATTTTTQPPLAPEVCNDGIDNDFDGNIDCADADCAGVPACSAGNRLTTRRVTGTVLGIGPGDGLWNATTATTYSMAWRDDIADTCPPDNNCSGNQPTLRVKAIHNGTSIAFRLSWNDLTKNNAVYAPAEFGDRAVVMLNANRICQMGSPTNPTNMWFWNAADKTQGQYGSVQNLLGGGLGTITHTSGDDNILVVSSHTGTEWQVVMSRPLATIDPTDQFAFSLGVTTNVAFALYDGAHKQRNGAKWISGLESMDIAP